MTNFYSNSSSLKTGSEGIKPINNADVLATDGLALLQAMENHSSLFGQGLPQTYAEFETLAMSHYTEMHQVANQNALGEISLAYYDADGRLYQLAKTSSSSKDLPRPMVEPTEGGPKPPRPGGAGGAITVAADHAAVPVSTKSLSSPPVPTPSLGASRVAVGPVAA